MVSLLRETPTLELEARLGQMKNAKFVAGVEREEVDRMMDMMQKSSHLTPSGDWIEEQDFFYVNDNRVACRTRVVYNHDTMSIIPTTIQKKTISNVTSHVMDIKGNALNEHIRISIKEEKPIDETSVCVETSLVRLKQKRKFKTLCNIWSFEFSMIWSGATKTEAEASQATNNPVFEVECEIVDPCKILAMQSDAKIATSLLLKMRDLLKSSNCVLSLVQNSETTLLG